MENEDKYFGGCIWEAPSFLRAMIVCGCDGFMFLVSDPAEQGSIIMTEKDGMCFYTMYELKKRLKNWTFISRYHCDGYHYAG